MRKYVTVQYFWFSLHPTQIFYSVRYSAEFCMSVQFWVTCSLLEYFHFYDMLYLTTVHKEILYLLLCYFYLQILLQLKIEPKKPKTFLLNNSHILMQSFYLWWSIFRVLYWYLYMVGGHSEACSWPLFSTFPLFIRFPCPLYRSLILCLTKYFNLTDN